MNPSSSHRPENPSARPRESADRSSAPSNSAASSSASTSAAASSAIPPAFPSALSTLRSSGSFAGKVARIRVGVLNPRRVRLFSFGTIVAAMFAAAGVCILSVWQYVKRDVGWRAIATLGIVIATMVAFTLINEFFGATLPAPSDPSKVA